MEKPASANAVIQTLPIVTVPVPNRRSSLLLNRLDTIVPPEIVMETNPA